MITSLGCDVKPLPLLLHLFFSGQIEEPTLLVEESRGSFAGGVVYLSLIRHISCLRADVCYFLCNTRKRDVCVTPSLIVPFSRAAKEIGDVCTQASIPGTGWGTMLIKLINGLIAAASSPVTCVQTSIFSQFFLREGGRLYNGWQWLVALS